MAGNEWFDVVGADLSDSGFGTNLSLHGGVFESCGPPIDPNSTLEEECFKFEEILGPYTPLQLLQIRGFLDAFFFRLGTNNFRLEQDQGEVKGAK